MITLTKRNGTPVVVNPDAILYLEQETRGRVDGSEAPLWTRVALTGGESVSVRENIETVCREIGASRAAALGLS